MSLRSLPCDVYLEREIAFFVVDGRGSSRGRISGVPAS